MRLLHPHRSCNSQQGQGLNVHGSCRVLEAFPWRGTSRSVRFRTARSFDIHEPSPPTPPPPPKKKKIHKNTKPCEPPSDCRNLVARILDRTWGGGLASCSHVLDASTGSYEVHGHWAGQLRQSNTLQQNSYLEAHVNATSLGPINLQASSSGTTALGRGRVFQSPSLLMARALR